MSLDNEEHVRWLQEHYSMTKPNQDPDLEYNEMYQEAIDILDVIDNTTPDWSEETARLREIIGVLY